MRAIALEYGTKQNVHKVVFNFWVNHWELSKKSKGRLSQLLLCIQFWVKYIQIWLHLLMTDRCKSSFFLSKKGLQAIPSSNLMKKNDKQSVKLCAKAQIIKNLAVFFRQILNLWETKSRNLLIFSIKIVLVLCFTFWLILIEICRSVFEKNVNKHYKMAWNYKTDSHIMTPWRAKSSKCKISSCYKVSSVSKKTCLGTTKWEMSEISRLTTCYRFFIKCKCMVTYTPVLGIWVL